MSGDPAFAARLLDAGAGGYAGLATSLLFERAPGLTERFGTDAFARWREQLAGWLEHLSAALDADEPGLFEARVRWTRAAFESREVSIDDLRVGLESLRDTLSEKLPPIASGAAAAFVEAGMATLTVPPTAEAGGLDPADPDQRRALEYLRTVLEGGPRDALERVVAEVDAGLPVHDAYLKRLIPAQQETGRLWHAGELSIAEERLVTSTTQRTMALLCERARPSARIDRTVVLACVSRNVHDLGVRAIADFFDMAGWRALNLGADVPAEDVANSVRFFDADLVVLAATLDTQLRAVRQTIEAVRAEKGSSAKVIVGGPIFAEASDLWRKLGADGYAASIAEAEPLGRRLTD